MSSRSRIQFHIEWDPDKELANFRKHGVRFRSAMTVLHDPLALSREDYDHDAEERWITLGAMSDETLVVVVHTYKELSDREVIVRIISARRPTKDERFQYQSG